MRWIGRPKATILLNAFRRRGLLETDRGIIRITDPKKLAKLACECHSVIDSLYRKLYGG